MKLSLRIAVRFAAPCLASALVACAHHPPPVSQTATTSARAPRTNVSTQREASAGMRIAPVEEEGPAVEGDVAIDLWQKRYPDAAKELGDWMRLYPQAAAKLSEWDAAHPIRMKALVDWAITQKYGGFGAFLYNRAGWDDFSQLTLAQAQAMNEFLDWVRRSPNAAEELATHPDALAWAHGHIKEPPNHVPIAPTSVAADVGAASQGAAEPPANRAPQAPQAKKGASTYDSPWIPTPTSVIR